MDKNNQSMDNHNLLVYPEHLTWFHKKYRTITLLNQDLFSVLLFLEVIGVF